MMKKHYILLMPFFFALHLNAQIVNIPDINFKAALLSADLSNQVAKDLTGNYFTIDGNGDQEIETNEALQVSALNVSGAQITSLIGIETFINLQSLDCANNNISVINENTLNSLSDLNCLNNQLTTLDVNGLSLLKNLDCGNNQLTMLEVDGLSNLQNLTCSNNQLTTLNTTGLSSLLTLSCSYNELTGLSLTGLNNLQILVCNWNPLFALNTSGLSNLQSIHCSYSQLSTLNINGLSSLQELYCDNNNLTTLNASGLGNLIYLDCTYNQLNSILLNGSNNLQRLESRNNQLTTLNLSNTSHLEFLGCQYNNQLTSLYIKNGANESLNANHCDNISYVCADDFQLGAIDSRVSNPNCVINTDCNLSVTAVTIAADKINIYPNPATNILTIEANDVIKKVSIYNMLGQLILVSNTLNIDVSNLKVGNYLVKLSTEKGSFGTRFIKE